MPIPLPEMPHAPAWQAALALAPALAAAAGALGAGWLADRDTASTWRVARIAVSTALFAAAASLVALAATGGGQAHGVRVDLAGGILALLAAFIGWVIVGYSRTYLAGSRGEAGSVRWLLAALAAVLLVAVTNHLLVLAIAWAATGLAVHRLLTYFPERAPALTAAHKKFVLGRLADAAMLAACGLLAYSFGTLQIDVLLARATATGPLPLAVQAAAVLVAVAALLRCAQLPFHGWLIQVMEAPTPVSALLHAGVVNLGGFVLIRLAPIVAEVPAAAGLLVAAGTCTAVVAALVMTTRISIKVALAWSTCAQMGFMLLQCGLGLWEMALLHLVAHSLYKAHAFLSAGGVVRRTQLRQLAPQAPPPGLGVLLVGIVALAALAAVAYAVGLRPQASPAPWVMAGIAALAIVPMLRPSPNAAGFAVMLRAAATAAALVALWIGLHALLEGRVVAAPAMPDAPWWLLAAAGFAALFVVQAIVTARPHGALATRLYPWFYGGLFVDERFSRAMFRLWPPPKPALAAAQPAAPHAA